MLVECLVALVLLAGASSLLLLAAGTVTRLADEATLQDVALREEMSASAGLAADPCAVTAGVRTPRLHPRLEVHEDLAVAGSLRRLRLHAQWQARALAGGRTREGRSSTAGWCE